MMQNSTVYKLLLVITGATYFIASKYLFNSVYDAIDVVIDELFHIPQGLAFCNRNFTYWDPKITTLPGLYLISTAFLGSYFECNTYNLRFINLIASTINFLLFASILKFVYGNSPLKTVLQALNFAILPPLYFFAHVYYTDTLSLMFLLAFSRLCFTNNYKLPIIILGYLSVLMRQTNIVWIAMVLGHKVLDIFIKSSRVFGNNQLTNMSLRKDSMIAKDVDNSKLKRYYGITDVYIALKYHVTTCFTTFFHYLTFNDWLIIFMHSTVLISFVAFVYVNGSIVVGDKQAHQATIHIPQIFYFLIFYGVFGLPCVLNKFSSTFKLMFSNKVKIILLTALFAAIVHYNTIVHPYLLADNRHYTFYIWNRWFGKYDFAIYASVPVYIFLLVNLYANLKNQNCISFLLPYSVCLFVSLCLQKMIEVRYFLIPYIILRLRFARPSLSMILLEFVWYICINIATFHLFFNKEIMWNDFEEPQRLIW
ncbi:putative Dol-P-Glc:Glc(2)Man(9)GlcNAc(2)-PP-Dol alpha-1,2-glucosyltransferase [Pectinophora gossypiella]|uniref:putative Dol-P-Glc:Glc(2)Man(9)GlcNAc(2)-PP-Dol alpha-1,2-glucosyltransferase n=1 Tax=Pectinophora gossypiella TaxID=13191 RepID=UPI00214EEB9E|nr:putative Dol-P-Glc:Glc(2)Man(9)GlcNAc(2)-PP-Dol alpha-1,2-glucosyltransferase [Pectinophora gossypiella]